MAVFKCKMCGGTISFNPGDTVGICDFCGTKQTLPHLGDEKQAILYDRANHYRRNNEFDKAERIYEQILGEDIEDAETYWSLVLCRYGIEYVEDPTTHRRLPTVNRSQFTSIFDDINYKSAIYYADSFQRDIYEAEARAINDIQKSFLAISQKEEPFDVFICYKETDHNGRRTPDSVLANDLYHALTDEGYKVFFSRITLEDKLGTEYEPYIFAALNSSKVMVVLGTKAEHFNAVWVKNEWSRFLALVKQSDGKKVLIPAYRDMDPYDLPEEFSHLQAQDMSKLGFMQDLIRGINKIEKANQSEKNAKESIVIGENPNAEPLLRRAYIFLEDGEWRKAEKYFEKVLDQDPENAQAYLGKLMAELYVNRQVDLPNCEKSFDQNLNYRRAVRFGSDQLRETLSEYIKQINERNERARLQDKYDSALSAMDTAEDEETYQWAAKAFKSIPGYKDADTLAEKCYQKAEVCRKNAIYAFAKSQMSGNDIAGYRDAIKTFKTISGWKDAEEQIQVSERKIEEIKAKQEADRLEGLRQAEIKRIASQKREKILIRIFVAFIFFLIVTVIVLFISGVALSAQQQKKANELLSAGQYDEAYKILEEIGNHEAITASKNDRAAALIKSEKYDEAYKIYEKTGNHEAIASSKYDRAVALIKSGDYEQAYLLLDGINFKDSIDKQKSIKPQFEKAQLAKAEVGTIVRFGAYEQDNNTSNGKEEIEWKVLAKEGNKALLLSKYALDCKPINETDSETTWETCTLRSWLNKDFLEEAFVTEEQSKILDTNVKDRNNAYNINPGNETVDKTFLLSIDEANLYFDDARKCSGTKYCFSQGAKAYYNNTCVCWLRSPGYDLKNFACIDDLALSNYGENVSDKHKAVRPALWVSLDL